MTRQKSSKKHMRLRKQYVPTSWGKNELYLCEELKVTQRGAKYQLSIQGEVQALGPPTFCQVRRGGPWFGQLCGPNVLRQLPAEWPVVSFYCSFFLNLGPDIRNFEGNLNKVGQGPSTFCTFLCMAEALIKVMLTIFKFSGASQTVSVCAYRL